MGNLTEFNTEFKTKVYKGRDGWEAYTDTAQEGAGYRISTCKTRGGIRSYAQKGTFVNGNFTFMMFTDKSIDLCNSTAKCTENSIKELHTQALANFIEKTAGESAPYIVPVGQKVISYGYAMNINSDTLVVYEIINSVTFAVVNTETLELSIIDHLRDIEEKHGIGRYYVKNDVFEDLEALTNIVIKAKQKEAEKTQKIKIANEKAQAEKTQKIEAGKKIVSIPSNAVAVIVAELMEDDSDPYTDYHASHATKTIYLAFSSHKRDLFAEMRKACLNCDIEEIRAFAVVPTVNRNGDDKTEENAEYWEPSDEHREKYSMGAGYYLQEGHSRSGWRISKNRYINLENCPDLYIATQEERYFCNAEIEPEKTNFEEVKVEAGEIQIIDYSEKAIAVIGDTRPIKDQLKQLGGKFNFRLSCGAGWIFPKSKLSEIEELFSNEDEAEEETENQKKSYDFKREENGAFNVPGHLTVYDYSGRDVTNIAEDNKKLLEV